MSVRNNIKLDRYISDGYPITNDMSLIEIENAYQLRLLTIKAIKHAVEENDKRRPKAHTNVGTFTIRT